MVFLWTLPFIFHNSPIITILIHISPQFFSLKCGSFRFLHLQPTLDRPPFDPTTPIAVDQTLIWSVISITIRACHSQLPNRISKTQLVVVVWPFSALTPWDFHLFFLSPILLRNSILIQYTFRFYSYLMLQCWYYYF